MFKINRRSPLGMTTIELMVGATIFTSIMALALTILNRWMNVSRTSDYRLKATEDARKAMLTMAEDVRKAEYIVTNYWIKLDPAPPAPYPNYDEYGSSTNPFPIVVQEPSNVKNLAILPRVSEELKTNSICLVCSDTAGSAEVKSYILYYAKRYQENGKIHVGLFRYEFKDSVSNYRFYNKVTNFNDGTPSAELKLGTPATPYPSGVPNPFPSPTVTRLVDDLFFKHDPDYHKSKSDSSGYLFRIYNLHPYSNDNWMSPFYVEIAINVGYARKTLDYLNLARYGTLASINYSAIPYYDDKTRSEIDFITLKTVALAKGILMPK